jgi:hypothetical protein
VQSSHARKRLKAEAHHALDKGKAIACPSLISIVLWQLTSRIFGQHVYFGYMSIIFE